MNNLEKELDEYVKDTLSFANASRKTRQNWAFGAINFAQEAGIITGDKANELYRKYELT